jgi:CRP-like cAMP-binding protein
MTLPVILKLERFAPLSAEDKQVLAEAVTLTRDLEPNEDLIREGEQPSACHVILDGMLCRYKLLPEGRRQIVGFQIAGDLCDLSGIMMGGMDHSVGSLTPAKVGVIPHETLTHLMEQHPHLARALWQEMLAEASIAREWVANVGRRSAYQRVAHLLCEVGQRLQAVGHASDGSFELRLNQDEVADAMGLSIVHVNRTLQQLRHEGLILTRGATIQVPDWQRLQEAGEFSPDYLFLSARTQEQVNATAC